MKVNDWIAANEKNLCDSLCGLIRIKSVCQSAQPDAPFGKGIADCLDEALRLGESLGLRCGRMGGYVGFCEWGEGEEMVAVLAHLDVVPEGCGWSIPAYDGVMQHGRIYGRGAIDDKGPAVAALYALAALRQSGVTLCRRVRVLLGTNEESGAAGIRYYVANGGEIPVSGFTPDAEYPVINGEKGIANLTFTAPFSTSGSLYVENMTAGEAANIVPATATAKIVCPSEMACSLCKKKMEGISLFLTETGFEIKAQGVSAHAASPWEGINAAGLLAKFVARLPLEKEAAAMQLLANKIGTDWSGRGLGVAYEDDQSGPLTFNLGCVDLQNGWLTVKCNLRIPAAAEGEKLLLQVKENFEKAGFLQTESSFRPGFYLPQSHPLVTALSETFKEETGLELTPKCIGGGTYAKAIPNVVAFGPVFPGDEVREHKPDEFIQTERLLQNCRIMAAAMQKLANQKT